MTKNICLFGRHFLQIYLINKMNKLGFKKPLIILDKLKTYTRDKKLLTKYNLFADIESLAKRNKVKIIYLSNINSRKMLDLLKKNNINLGFSLGCRQIFKQNIIRYFKGNLYNLHDSYLPYERGGGLNSWRILLNRKIVGNTIHKVERGIDNGDIVLQRKIKILKKFPFPIDYDLAQQKNSVVLLDNFLMKLKNKKKFLLRKQNINKSEYFSRLYTKNNGALDVDQKPEKFERFVRAFSFPYEGAWILKENKKIFIKNVKVIKQDIFSDKIFNGRVYRKYKDGRVLLIIGGGLIEVKEVFLKNKRYLANSFFKLNSVIRNSPKTLFLSRSNITNISKFN
tara:strand:+ start:184 stop:1200 length:1017 start_codon:yes stop_codon:yes gene_type:complete